MAKKTKTQGKKGGFSITPETIGVMAGAAIGGVAGMMLGNQKARQKLAAVKNKAFDTAGEVVNEFDSQTEGLQKEGREIAEGVISRGKKVKEDITE